MAKTTHTADTPRLKALYNSTYKKELQAELNLANIHQVPKLEKIVVSVGLGKNKDDKRHYEVVKNTLTKITGQAPIDRMAKKSIAGFKIRAGMNRIGVSVTLRGARMYEFMDRFINVAMPRIRDFHGVGAKAFDKGGNYNVGMTGLQVTFVIANHDASHSRALLEKFGMPFEKEGGRR